MNNSTHGNMKHNQFTQLDGPQLLQRTIFNYYSSNFENETQTPAIQKSNLTRNACYYYHQHHFMLAKQTALSEMLFLHNK